MVVLKAKNPNLEGLQRTFVRTAIAAAGTALSVTNTNGFAANDFVVIGSPKSETRELVQISSITDDDDMVVGAVNFAHAEDEPVNLSVYDQVRFQNGTTQTGTFSTVTTLDVQWDKQDDFTTHNFAGGSASEWFRYVFRNTQTSRQSQNSVAVQIPTFYCTVGDVAEYLNVVVGTDTPTQFRQVIKAIRFATSEVDNITNSSFKSISITTAAYEFHDGKKTSDDVYFLRNLPVISVESLEITTANPKIGVNDATWTSLTEDEDFYLDKPVGTVTIIDPLNIPAEGHNRVRVTYSHGHNFVPDDVRLLTTLVAVRHLSQSGVLKSLNEGREGDRDLSDLNRHITDIAGRYQFGGLENT